MATVGRELGLGFETPLGFFAVERESLLATAIAEAMSLLFVRPSAAAGDGVRDFIGGGISHVGLSEEREESIVRSFFEKIQC